MVPRFCGFREITTVRFTDNVITRVRFTDNVITRVRFTDNEC